MSRILAGRAATAAIAITIASSAFGQVTLGPTDGSPLANQIYGISATGTQVFGSSPNNNNIANVTFTGNTQISVGSGFAQINDADYSMKDAATQDWFKLIINPNADFTDFKFAVQLKDQGTISVYYLLTGLPGNANAFATYTSLAGTFAGGPGNVNQLLSGGTFNGLMVSTTSPIELFEIKQMSFNGVPGAVPEPGTWALMLLGFAGVGSALRRSRRGNGRLLQIA